MAKTPEDATTPPPAIGAVPNPCAFVEPMPDAVSAYFAAVLKARTEAMRER